MTMSKESSGLFPNRLPSNKAHINHMFEVRPGHLANTQKNRDTISRIANDESLYAGTDQWGNRWYIEPLGNGGQHWAEVDSSGRIWDGGYNRSPIEWNPQTGLKKPVKPTGKKKIPVIKPKKRGTK